MPPVAAAAVNEQSIPASTYVSTNNEREDLKVGDLKPEIDDPVLYQPVPTWDPDVPDVRPTPYSKLVKPLRVTLNEGDMMYLPAMWYHKVGQSCGDEGYCCAVNYWYVLIPLQAPIASAYIGKAYQSPRHFTIIRQYIQRFKCAYGRLGCCCTLSALQKIEHKC